MKCERCNQNEATVFYTENINGKETKMNLCSKCYAEIEKASAIKFEGLFDANLFTNMFAPKAKQRESIAGSEKCSLCGKDFSFIARSGKAGCPKCYESFASLLAPTLRRLHGASTHRGKIPAKYKEKLSAKREIEELEDALKKSVALEEYEKAAEIRDRLRDIRNRGES